MIVNVVFNWCEEGDGIIQDRTESATVDQTLTEGESGGGNDSSSSQIEGSQNGRLRNDTAGVPRHKGTASPRESNGGQEKNDMPDDRNSEVTNVLRAFRGQTTFSGIYDEDLEANAEHYAGTADSCDVADAEKGRTMFPVLHGRSRTPFNRKGKECRSFQEEIGFLRSC